MKINIKPLSVNEAFQGRRYKTVKYKNWEREILYALPRLESKLDLSGGEIYIYIEWGFSTKSADIDNPTKVFLDCLQKKYGFNDKNIQKLHLSKTLVSKGNEYINYRIFTNSGNFRDYLVVKL